MRILAPLLACIALNRINSLPGVYVATYCIQMTYKQCIDSLGLSSHKRPENCSIESASIMRTMISMYSMYIMSPDGSPLPHLPRKILKTNSKRKILCKILHPKGLDVKIFIRKELPETFGQTRREPG